MEVSLSLLRFYLPPSNNTRRMTTMRSQRKALDAAGALVARRLIFQLLEQWKWRKTLNQN